MSTDVYVGIGSNLGDRSANIQAGLRFLSSAGAVVDRVSSLYETEPRECAPQPDFLNGAALVWWNGSSRDLLSVLLQAEVQAGRARSLAYAPRPLDLDLLLFGREVIAQPDLVVPHPRLHLRRFVLVPLAEIAPTVTHPVLRKTAEELLSDCADTGKVTRVAAPPQILTRERR